MVAAHARAHPNATGAVTLRRSTLAQSGGVQERGTLRLGPAGLRLTLDGDAAAELVLGPASTTVFDAMSNTALTQVGPTPFARYAEVLGGAALETLFAARALDGDEQSAALELRPEPPWPGIERLVVRVDVAGEDRGRVLRVLALSSAGGWVRVDLGAVRYPETLDPRQLEAAPHPGALRVEL
jgi:hypothetical protein